MPNAEILWSSPRRSHLPSPALHPLRRHPLRTFQRPRSVLNPTRSCRDWRKRGRRRRRGNGSAPRHSIPQHGPEDMDDNSDKSLDGIRTPNGKKSEVPRTPRGPVAGTFQLTPQSAEPMKTTVITGHQPVLPPPYPRSRRLFSSGDRAGHHVCTRGRWGY